MTGSLEQCSAALEKDLVRGGTNTEVGRLEISWSIWVRSRINLIVVELIKQSFYSG